LIIRAKKLLSGVFAFIFKSIKAKKAWQKQEALKATFKAFVKTIKFTFNVIIFDFLKRAINKVMLDKRLGAIISQNLSFKNSLCKIRMLKKP
jgi:hypothetical protein